MTAAAELKVGDIIAPGFLPCKHPATVVFTYRYTLMEVQSWVFVVMECPSGSVDGMPFQPGGDVPLAAVPRPVTAL